MSYKPTEEDVEREARRLYDHACPLGEFDEERGRWQERIRDMARHALTERAAACERAAVEALQLEDWRIDGDKGAPVSEDDVLRRAVERAMRGEAK